MDADSVIRLRRVVLGLARRLNAASVGEGLTPAQASVLAVVVNRGRLGLTELSEIEGLNPTMLSRVVGSLTSLGLVHRRRDPDDYRAVQVEVTADGEAIWQRISAERAQVISECVACLPAEQEAALAAALPALENLAERLLETIHSNRLAGTIRRAAQPLLTVARRKITGQRHRYPLPLVTPKPTLSPR